MKVKKLTRQLNKDDLFEDLRLKPKTSCIFYYLLQLKFPAIKRLDCLFVFGNTIYSDVKIPWYLIPHEKQHIKQQGTFWKGIIWWFKYWKSKDFRYKQELEAYRRQYAYYCKVIGDREDRNKFLALMVNDLSSDKYGNIRTWQEAREDVRQGIK